MRRKYRFAGILLILLFCGALSSCTIGAIGNKPRKVAAVDVDPRGTYTLILGGCTHAEDLENYAILDKENDRFILDPYTSSFNYRIKTGMTANEALKEAREFINCHSSFKDAELQRIVNSKGITIGYELRPQHFAMGISVSDIQNEDTEVYSYRKKILEPTKRKKRSRTLDVPPLRTMR